MKCPREKASNDKRKNLYMHTLENNYRRDARDGTGIKAVIYSSKFRFVPASWSVCADDKASIRDDRTEAINKTKLLNFKQDWATFLECYVS